MFSKSKTKRLCQKYWLIFFSSPTWIESSSWAKSSTYINMHEPPASILLGWISWERRVSFAVFCNLWRPNAEPSPTGGLGNVRAKCFEIVWWDATNLLRFSGHKIITVDWLWIFPISLQFTMRIAEWHPIGITTIHGSPMTISYESALVNEFQETLAWASFQLGLNPHLRTSCLHLVQISAFWFGNAFLAATPSILLLLIHALPLQGMGPVGGRLDAGIFFLLLWPLPEEPKSQEHNGICNK